MGLNKEEKATLDRLNQKAKEPDAPPPSLSYNLDLSDDKAYERAVKLNLIPGADNGDGEGEGEGEGGEGGGEGDEIPRRRSSLADRMMGGS